MVDVTPNILGEEKLLPVRYPQAELFICDVADAVLKDDMASMEHPVFSLTKQKDTTKRKYVSGDKWIEIVPSVDGMATIYDKDILIFCMSQMIAKMNAGGAPQKRVKLVARDLLQFTNRNTGGRDYEALCGAIARLRGTNIVTNIKTADTEQRRIFGLIEEGFIERSPKTNRIRAIEITLSDWLFNAIKAKEVLTLHPDYFRLKKGIERRIYEIARKHCGKQDRWSIGLDNLKRKCGSRIALKAFRYEVKQIATGNHLPDYKMVLKDEGDLVEFENRDFGGASLKFDHPQLDPEAIHDGRAIAEGWDIYSLEQEFWEKWHRDGRQRLFDPTKAFIGFVRKVVEQRGPAR